MATLLESLGLIAPQPASTAGAAPATAPTLQMRPTESKPATGLKLPADYNIDDPKQPGTFKMPADPQAQVELLADAISKTQDAVKRDKLVRALRDALARIQPVMSGKDAKKDIDKAIDSLVESGSKKLLLTVIETIIGKKATEMPDDDHRTQTGPAMKEKDLGEHILKSPEIPIGKAPAVHRNAFEFRGLPKSAKPSAYIDFKLRTPDWFEPYGKMGAGWVVIAEADDFKKNGESARRVHDRHIEAKGEISLSLAMPDDAGQYVVAVKVGSTYEPYPVENIEIRK
jgi:hypothetical protein